MPIYSATSATDTDFTGLAAATGLFDAAVSTGGQSIQVRINSISFSGPTAITDWTLNLIDPSDGQTTVVLTSDTTEFLCSGPGGFMLLPTNSDGAPWRLNLVTSGLTGVGVLKICYDFEQTPG